jgi:hypothetical protein
MTTVASNLRCITLLFVPYVSFVAQVLIDKLTAVLSVIVSEFSTGGQVFVRWSLEKLSGTRLLIPCPQFPSF